MARPTPFRALATPTAVGEVPSGGWRGRGWGEGSTAWHADLGAPLPLDQAQQVYSHPPPQGALCRSPRDAHPHPPKWSPPCFPRYGPGGRKLGGAPHFLTVSAPQKLNRRGPAPPRPPLCALRAPPRRAPRGPGPRPPPGGGAMNGTPLPHGGGVPAAAQVRPASPGPGRQKRHREGPTERSLPPPPSPKLTDHLPLPKTKKPPLTPSSSLRPPLQPPTRRHHFGGAAPSGYCSACRERAQHPSPIPGGHLGKLGPLPPPHPHPPTRDGGPRAGGRPA